MDYTSWLLRTANLAALVTTLALFVKADNPPDIFREDSLPFDLCGPEYRSMSEEQRLMRDLMGHYDPSVRPVYNAHSAVDVELGLTLTQILDLDEKNQVLTTNVWLEASWYDERLNWTSADYAGIESIRIPPDKIWLPDIVLYNSVDDYTSGYMPSLAMVYNDSRVFWGPVIRFRSACNIDITFFPFDNQICKLKMGSWAYNGLQVNVWNRSSTMDLSNFVDNGEWELLAIRVQRNVVFYACCKEPFPDVTFTIVLRRRTKYYFMNIIIPCIILSFLCLGGFLLPPESGEKITLGLSVLLTITVFMLMVADKMPQTSESISVISIYLMAVLSTSCMTVLSSVLVLSIHHQRGQPKRAPLWLRRLCFGIFGRMFHLDTTNKDPCTAAENEKTLNDSQTPAKTSSTKKRKRQQASKYNRKDKRFMNNSRIGCCDEDSECMSLDPKVTLANEGEPHHVQFSINESKDWNDSNSKPLYDRYPEKNNSNTSRYQRHNINFQCSSPSFSSYREMDEDTSFVVAGKAHQLRQGQGQVCGQCVSRCTCDQSNKSHMIDESGEYDTHQKLSSLPPPPPPPSFTPQQTGVTSQQGSKFETMSNNVLEDQSLLKGMTVTQRYNVIMVTQLASLIRDKQSDDVTKEDIFLEWHNIAYVLDRLLFIFFLTLTIVSTACILQMRPSEVEL